MRPRLRKGHNFIHFEYVKQTFQMTSLNVLTLVDQSLRTVSFTASPTSHNGRILPRKEGTNKYVLTTRPQYQMPC